MIARGAIGCRPGCVAGESLSRWQTTISGVASSHLRVRRIDRTFVVHR